jgi:hypothetical protein
MQGVFPPAVFFLPINWGKALFNPPPPPPTDSGIQGDDTGDNISMKNKTFAELTGLYWAWKNLKKLYPDVEYVGLCHYRRYFARSPCWANPNLHRLIPFNKLPALPGKADFEQMLKRDQVILAQQTFFTCTNSQYYKTHPDACYSSDWEVLKKILSELCPDYNSAFLEIWKSNRMSWYCAFVAEYDFLDKYCRWLFPILFEAERRIKTDNYTTQQKRVFAYFGEYLLNVYIKKHQLRVKRLPMFFLVEKKLKPYWCRWLKDLFYGIIVRLRWLKLKIMSWRL